MAAAIKLPDMGTNVEECKVLCWRVQKGAAVKRGDILADIETDKRWPSWNRSPKVSCCSSL